MVKGLASLRRKLTKTIPDRVLAATERAMVKSADEIVASMKAFAPVDDGDLRDSIGWTWGDPPQGAAIVARSGPSRQTGLRITIYAGNDEAFYARWVEFGTAPHAIGKGGDVQHPGATASPFFFPGYRLNQKRAKSRITRELRKAIRAGAKS